jgi:hypothetical protein
MRFCRKIGASLADDHGNSQRARFLGVDLRFGHRTTAMRNYVNLAVPTMPLLVADKRGAAETKIIAAAYLLVSMNRLKGDSVAYQVLNLVGGVFLIVNTIYWGAYPSTFVNGVWVCIAVFAIARIARK